MSDSQEQQHDRFRSRGRRNLSAGMVVGAAIGLAVGLLFGSLAFSGRAGAVAASALAGAIFGVIVGSLIGGYSTLESPDPGSEPSDTERPLADRPQLTRDEGHPAP
jgi:hypothetical protein